MRLVFAGTPEVAAATLAAILERTSHDVVAVVTRPDAPQGRSRRPVPSPVARLASERGIEVLRPARPADPAFLTRLVELAPDVCPVVAYGALIPGNVLAVPRLGWINVHYSLLPRWRGAAPVQRAILAGDAETGVSVFALVPELDAGPVYASAPYRLGELETAGEALAALQPVGTDLLIDTLDGLAAGTATAVDQPGEGVTLAPKLAVAEARIDWLSAAVPITRQVRACNPAPMAWTMLADERFRVLLARPEPGTGLAPGQVAAGKHEARVGTGDGDLILLRVQPAGRAAMAGADWGRGLREPVRLS